MLAPPSETTVVKRWTVRFPKVKSKNMLKNHTLGNSILRTRFLFIESYRLPVIQLDNESDCESFRNRVCIAIRKPEDLRMFLEDENKNKNEEDENEEPNIPSTIRRSTLADFHIMDHEDNHDMDHEDHNGSHSEASAPISASTTARRGSPKKKRLTANDSHSEASTTTRRSPKKKRSTAKSNQMKTKFILDLFDLEIQEGYRSIKPQKNSFNNDSTCNITIEHNGKKEQRQIIFATIDELKEFCALITQYKEESVFFQRERFENMVQNKDFRKMAQERCIAADYDTFSKQTIELLIEIVGVVGLRAHPSPFVEVRLLDEVIHRTKTIDHE